MSYKQYLRANFLGANNRALFWSCSLLMWASGCWRWVRWSLKWLTVPESGVSWIYRNSHFTHIWHTKERTCQLLSPSLGFAFVSDLILEWEKKSHMNHCKLWHQSWILSKSMTHLFPEAVLAMGKYDFFLSSSLQKAKGTWLHFF